MRSEKWKQNKNDVVAAGLRRYSGGHLCGAQTWRSASKQHELLMRQLLNQDQIQRVFSSRAQPPVYLHFYKKLIYHLWYEVPSAENHQNFGMPLWPPPSNDSRLLERLCECIVGPQFYIGHQNAGWLYWRQLSYWKQYDNRWSECCTNITDAGRVPDNDDFGG